MRVSSKDDLILNQVPVSSDHCDTTTCQFTIDFNATDTSVFFVSIATISDSRIGPHSDEVKSVLGENTSVVFNVHQCILHNALDHIDCSSNRQLSCLLLSIQNKTIKLSYLSYRLV